MSAAATGPAGVPHPLAGVAGPLGAFRARLTDAAGSVQSAVRRVRQAAAAVDRLGGGTTPAVPLLRTLRVNAEGAGRSVTRLAGSATKAAAELRSGATRSRGTSSTLASLAGAAGGFVSVAGLLGQFTGPMSRAMTVLGIGLGTAAAAMTAVNVAMRANPLGFLAGLVVPVVTAITAYALSTETGQKIVKQVFDHVLKVFREIATFLGPVVTSCGTVVGTYFKAVGTVVTTVAGIVGAAVSGDFGRAGAAVSRATGALSDLVRRPWNAFKEAVRPALDWITRRIPDMFTRVRDATSGTLGGIGDFVSTGLQALAGVVTGPVKGLIAFANWVIDGLNSLGGEFLGKKFGVDLDKIPQLAEGGVIAPSYDGASAVRPLSSLDRLRPAEAGRRVDAPRPRHRGRLHTYREPEGRSALTIAEDLLFLHRTAA